MKLKAIYSFETKLNPLLEEPMSHSIKQQIKQALKHIDAQFIL